MRFHLDSAGLVGIAPVAVIGPALCVGKTVSILRLDGYGDFIAEIDLLTAFKIRCPVFNGNFGVLIRHINCDRIFFDLRKVYIDIGLGINGELILVHIVKPVICYYRVGNSVFGDNELLHPIAFCRLSDEVDFRSHGNSGTRLIGLLCCRHTGFVAACNGIGQLHGSVGFGNSFKFRFDGVSC